MHQSNLNFSKTQQVSITAESRVWLKKEKEKEKKEEEKDEKVQHDCDNSQMSKLYSAFMVFMM